SQNSGVPYNMVYVDFMVYGVCCKYSCVSFFFQAEDGIRDRTVTGVQTCALPISRRRSIRAVDHPGRPGRRREDAAGAGARPIARSEERRVGKECRWRWARYDEKRKGRGAGT